MQRRRIRARISNAKFVTELAPIPSFPREQGKETQSVSLDACGCGNLRHARDFALDVVRELLGRS